MFQENQKYTVVLYTCGYCSRAFHQPKSNEQPGEDFKKLKVLAPEKNKLLNFMYFQVGIAIFLIDYLHVDSLLIYLFSV